MDQVARNGLKEVVGREGAMNTNVGGGSDGLGDTSLSDGSNGEKV